MRLVFSVSRPYPRQCFQRPSILRPSCGNRAIRQKIRIKRSFCIQASSEIPQSGSSMSAELISSMKNKIQEALEAEKVEVVDVEGDGRHVTIDVIASAFEGKSSVDRQRMVYKAIWLELQDAVHAVDSMKTQTPNESER